MCYLANLKLKTQITNTMTELAYIILLELSKFKDPEVELPYSYLSSQV